MNRSSSNVRPMCFTTLQPEWILELHLSGRYASSSSSDFSEDDSIMPRTRSDNRTVNRLVNRSTNRSSSSNGRRNNSASDTSSTTIDLSDLITEEDPAAYTTVQTSSYRIVVDLPDTPKNPSRNGITDIIEISDSPVRNTPSTSNMSNLVIDLCSSPEPESEHDCDCLPSPPDCLVMKQQRYPTCPICISNLLEESQVVTTKCGHIFCKKCILESLSSKSCCPMCRKKVLKSQLTTVYLNSSM